MSIKKDQTNFIREEMMERRTVVLRGEINDESVEDIEQRLLRLQIQSSAQINLIIDSGGGSIYAALHLCDLIQTLTVAPVRGIVLGECGSSATFVLLHCTERVSTPYSRFLIHSATRHEISVQINQTTSENLEQILREVKGVEDMVVALYMKRLTPEKNKNRDLRKFVQDLIARGDQSFGEWMSAEEAIKVGLIERIMHEKLDIFAP